MGCRVACGRPDAQSDQCRRRDAHPNDADRFSLQDRLADDEERAAARGRFGVDVCTSAVKLQAQASPGLLSSGRPRPRRQPDAGNVVSRGRRRDACAASHAASTAVST